MKFQRRSFLKSAGMLALAGATGVGNAETAPSDSRPQINKNNVVLFQGDSITDAGRNRATAAKPNDQSALGSGYAWLGAVETLTYRPSDELKFFNRGVSGDKIVQLTKRWPADCLKLKPDVLSILVGVNDYWHTFKHNYPGTPESYERDYRALLETTLKALPKVKLIIGEPYVLKFGVVTDSWFPAFDAYRAAATRVAKAFDARFIPYQSIFNEAVKYAPAEQWLQDGVHPTPLGASLMAHHWLKAANS